ncbi:MazG-like family protein [Actinoplanes sp. NEAU-A12]|uniref:MazG-like family protein n=1 Tax=Actinoplanes sandaracinus TaxID=3045177 RepID=A0ABT6WQ51_9ACTN|nr:MazG-like family protein [Actinoplanes sandaracinus]MDI6101882.1 MazG-like family protein [Actinoplanes sandaracinus]
MTTHTITDAARRIAAQLDARGNSDLTGLPETLCRALKVQEEAGEMAQAVIGVLGQNPRKGVTHTWDDVVHEAIDTVMAALVFAETVQPGMLELTLDGRLDYLRQRAAASGAPDTEAPADIATPGCNALGQRRAATLRWLLNAHTEHGLPLPESIHAYDHGSLCLVLEEDRPDTVRAWAALLGVTVTEREAQHGGNQWRHVSATTEYGTDPIGVGWKYVDIYTLCDRRPITAPAPLAVAA